MTRIEGVGVYSDKVLTVRESGHSDFSVVLRIDDTHSGDGIIANLTLDHAHDLREALEALIGTQRPVKVPEFAKGDRVVILHGARNGWGELPKFVGQIATVIVSTPDEDGDLLLTTVPGEHGGDLYVNAHHLAKLA